MIMLETGDDAYNDAFVERVVRPLPKPAPPPPPARTAAPNPPTSPAAPATTPTDYKTDTNHEHWRKKALDAFALVKAERGLDAANAQVKDCHTHRDRLSALNELLHIEDN